MITIDYIEDLLRRARAVPADPADGQLRVLLGLAGLRQAQVRATLGGMLAVAAAVAPSRALRDAAEAAAAEVAAMG